MNTKLRYLAGAAVSIPLLPLLYFQGKAIRKSFPDLPEAKGIQGIINTDSEKTLSILAIGESTIAGVGADTHVNAFAGQLASRLSELFEANIHWKVYAKSGYTAATVRQKIISKIDDKNVDLIAIGLGANDAFTLNRPSKWAKQTEALINDLRTKYPDTPIAFINMPPIKEFLAFTSLIKFIIGNLVEIHGQRLEKVVSRYPNVFYNSEIIIVDDWIERMDENVQRSDLFSDGVHPSKVTYREWAKDFAEFLIREKVLT